MNKINIPASWTPPKYQLGQRIEQGEIVGIEYHLPGTQRELQNLDSSFYSE
ncbi:hypothetical protein IQ247_09410 [Plectonema cf. radiosum LEGE 06105]|uniref:Uncharacterized protein n=1 Tax=Plectonema cf. radiosum LEGE 06105 TaxID=945769 RepID=A0A8J7FEN9_9CYAN|nr:hypothetical protein [Plectonema radiosum]MBE9212906.1 hypothetical protein [Plectonema cf. radiosum LEGE 06105]